jgi:hypothetical protein
LISDVLHDLARFWEQPNLASSAYLEIEAAPSRRQYLTQGSLIPLRYHQRGKIPTSGLGSIRAQTATGSII